MRLIFLSSFLLLTLTSCMQGHLAVHTDYLNREHLASYYIETPDPDQNYPMIGQRLLIEWNLPGSYLCQDDLHLEVRMRFGNHTELQRDVPIDKRTGFYIFTLSDEDYWEKEGIQTFKVDLIAGGTILETWQHQLWVELITVGCNDLN